MMPSPMPMQQIDPGQAIMKKVIADLSKTTSAQATEALQQGVPLNNIIEQLLKMTGGGTTSGGGGGPPGGGPQPPGGKKQEDTPAQNQGISQPAPSAAPGGSSQQGQQAGFDPVMSLLKELLDAQQNQRGQQGMTGQPQGQAPSQQGGIQPASEPKQPFSGPMGVLKSILPFPFAMKDLMGQKFESNQLANEQVRQKMTGQEPLQKGKREEIGLQGMVDLNKALATKGIEGLPADQAQKFGMVLEGIDAMNQIDQTLFGPGGLGGTSGVGLKGFFGSQTAKQFESALEQAIQLKTRAETGAAMTPKELESTKARYMPKAMDSLETARKKLKPLYDYYERTRRVIDPQGFHTNRALGGATPGSRQVGMTGKAKDGTPVKWDGKQWTAQ